MVTTACTMLLYSPARSPYVVMSVGKMLSFAPVSATKSPIRVRIFRLSAARISGRNLHFFCIFRPLMSAFFLLCVVSNSGISNPRHAPPKIRFRNLLYFSRLTNQFTVIFAPIWDNFGTIFEIFGKGFILTYLPEFQYVISVAGITRGKVLGKGFS